MQQQLETIIGTMRNKGFRVTPQRVAIVEYVMNADSHPSAEEIYKLIKKKYPMVSLATVYKTLELLTEMGVVRELSFADGARYDANIAKHVN
ncbi:MAG: Fur family transcriptional regulator, partial [Nitrososphaerales archaeon]